MAQKDTMPAVIDFWNKVADEFDSIYTGKGKSGFAQALDRYFRKDIYQRRQWSIDQAGDVKGKSVIDIGCGPGRFCSDYVKAGATRVLGLDTSPEMLKRARIVTKDEGTAHACEWVLSDIDGWKSDEKFDVAVAMGFWDYVADPRSRLRTIRAVTRGRFLSSWPRLWTWRVPLRKVRLQYIRGCPVYFFTRPQLERLFTETGWKIHNCEVIGKLYCVDARPV